MTRVKGLAAGAIAGLVLALCACTPQQAIIAALTPAGAATTLLGNLQQVGADNRKHVAELEREGRWDELAKFADENLRKDPHNHDWWIVKGYALTQARDFRGASEAYSQAVQIEPDSAMAWNSLAESYRAAGDPRRAVVVLERAMLVLRDVPTTPYLLGESYSDLKRYNEAAAAYRQALAMNQKFAAAWFGLSRAYSSLGRADEARQARGALEKIDPALAKRLDEPGADPDRDNRGLTPSR
jgi:tetratricopeptide (TPR) repeat protein